MNLVGLRLMLISSAKVANDYNDNGDVADANADEDIFDQDCQA